MAFRRQLGNLAGTLLDYRLQRRAAEDQNRMVSERQQELAQLQDMLRQAQAKDARDQALLQQGLAKPEQFEALGRAGMTEVAGLPIEGLRTSRGEAMGAAGKEIAGTKDRMSLPTDMDIEMSNQGRPGFPSKDPTAIETLMAQRNAKKGQFDAADAFDTEKKGEDALATALGRGMGEEEATATAFPAALQRKGQEGRQAAGIDVDKHRQTSGIDLANSLSRERQLTPIMVERAGATAGAAEQAKSVASANDPMIQNLAEQVLANPDLLQGQNMTPTIKGQVLAALKDTGFRSVQKQTAQKMLSTAWEALQQLKTAPGFEGAVGAKGPSSLFGALGTPLSGTKAGDYANKVDQLTASLTLPRLELLKGLGHMSDLEFGTVAKAVTSLKRNLSEPAFQAELANLEKGLADSMNAAGMSVPQIPGTPKVASPALESGRQKMDLLRRGR